MKIVLDKVNKGNHPNEYCYADYAKQFDNCDVIIDTKELLIKKNGKEVFRSIIMPYEEDSLTITYTGKWLDGSSFRIVRPGTGIISLLQLMGKETITFGSMYPDGYAVSFLVQ